MTYDPFPRGPFPVGVQTRTWTDAQRERSLPVEIWYPASDVHRGQDLDPSTWDVFTPGWASQAVAAEEMVHQLAVRDAQWRRGHPSQLVLLIHGWAGFRREATFLGTHLASHGYVVVSPDVLGTTYPEVDAFLTEQEPIGSPEALVEHVRDNAAHRVADVPFLVSRAVAELPVRPTGVGVVGASFGGFSSLVAPTADARIAAVAAMCPANGDAPVLDDPRVLEDHLRQPWRADAPTLILAADRDSLLPLYGQLRLLRGLPASDRKLVTLARTDHNHFVDDIDLGQAWLAEFTARVAAIYPDGPGDWPLIACSVQPIERLLPGELAQLAWRGVVTAHFDAHLRGNAAARALVDDPDAMLAGIGVESQTIVPGHV